MASRIVTLRGVAAVLVFDTVAAAAARVFGFPYAWASLGSFALYLGIGYGAARTSLRAPVQQAAVAAALAGLADASLGWAISWAIGPGQAPASVALTPVRWLSTAVTVTALAAALGAAGGVVGRRPPPSGAPAA